LRRAYEKIAIPTAYVAPARDRFLDPMTVERAFLDANSGLTANGIAVSCKQGHLVDVRICLTKDLEFRACPEVNRSGCRASRVSVPAVR
jgi:ribonuclease T2